MKLSKKAEYALRAVVAMAREAPGRTFSIQEIATSERIPLKFLEQILLVLKNGGVLRSKRGVGGGYQLARPPKRISLGELLELTDGEADPIPCSGASGQQECECGVVGGCALGRTLSELKSLVHEWLHKTTVADVIEKERPKDSMSFEI